MKNTAFKIENLLLILPLILFLVDKIFNDNSIIDIHFHDTYIVVSNTVVFIVVFGLMSVLYLGHFILRTTHKRDINICKTHVLVSSFLLLLIFSLSYCFPDTAPILSPKQYYDFSSQEIYSSVSIFYKILAFAGLLYFLIHTGFIIYFCIRIFRAPIVISE